MTPQALYVDLKGHYPAILGVDRCWGEDRDARYYPGTDPVIAHPPCGRWCAMAKLNEKRWGAKVGEDGGCFKAAFEAVQNWGGVLEHPANSLAWPVFSLTRPHRNFWAQHDFQTWVTEIHQSAYGHKARKRTWLMYVGDRAPFDLNWDSPKPTHQVGGGVHTGNNKLPRLSAKEVHLTPYPLAVELVKLAEWSRVR